ncbi:drebrin isoform X3 [Pleurodeles waltl]|uniref:drebrin isoform X3 n=1 Tax=Pleurodeles waltl TaxID=8319 RepID=UPI003709B084
MATVNFSTHRLALLAAYQDVIQEKTPTDWALYTYDGDTDDLTLSSSGGGGLPDLSSHFENQKVMYGFCSVKEPQATLPRYVLVNWVGEDVPDARKCACASHVAKIAEFFQGVDIIVNASSVEDIEPGAIGQRLSNGTARLASPVLNRLRVRGEESSEPVDGIHCRSFEGETDTSEGPEGTTYQKTNAAIEMKHLNREQFWEQAKKEEELRKEEEKRKALEDRLRFEQERMELERKEQEERERRYQEREQQIEEHRRKQLTLEEEEARQRLKEQSVFVSEFLAEPEDDEGTHLKRTESEVEEAAAIIAQRTENPLEFFKQQERVASTGSDTSLPLLHHRPGSNSDAVQRTPGSSATSPPDSSPSSSTPICDDSEGPPDTPCPAPKDAGQEGVQPASVPPTEDPWNPFGQMPQEAKIVDESPPPHPARLPDPEVSWAPTEGLVQVDDLVFMETKESEAFPAAPLPEEAESIMDLVDTANTGGGPTAVDNSQNLLDLWQSDKAGGWAGPGPGEQETGAWAAPCPKEQEAGRGVEEVPVPVATGESMQMTALDSLAGGMDDNLLNFDELPEPPATFCDLEPEDDPQSIIDIEGPHQMTLSYQHALQEASSSHEIPVVLVELEESHLMTNGETPQKEGATVSEGYFSQSQDDEFAQSDELSAKAPPVFYNKPPEIDITCWDTDPVMEEDEDEEGFGGNA